MKKQKTIFFGDELNDEFSKAKITPRRIDGEYRYCYDGFLGELTHFFWYRIIFTPIAFVYNKVMFRHKIIGREVFDGFKDRGYFIYGNHTQDIGDAFMPNFVNFPKHNYIVVHANNVSMPLLGRITPSLGALPLPDDMTAYQNFLAAIERRISEKKGIIIYPEAHIWPYYTGIRPFKDDSFYYPVKLNSPCFCFTNTYQRRKHSIRPRIVTYVDGPFYPDKNLSVRKQREDLRNRIYRCMTERAKCSDIEIIRYIKKEEENG